MRRLDDEIGPPFLVRGVAADELHGSPASRDDVRALERRPVRETLDLLAEHDTRIAEDLRRDGRPDRRPATDTNPAGARTLRQPLAEHGASIGEVRAAG
ncbi:MAG: hypothetical protein V7607_57 [Solirubrobacteraceae bacterium]